MTVIQTVLLILVVPATVYQVLKIWLLAGFVAYHGDVRLTRGLRLNLFWLVPAIQVLFILSLTQGW